MKYLNVIPYFGQTIKVKIFLWKPRIDINGEKRWLEFAEVILQSYLESRIFSGYSLIPFYHFFRKIFLKDTVSKWEIIKVLGKGNNE